MLEFFSAQPRCLVATEACVSPSCSFVRQTACPVTYHELWDWDKLLDLVVECRHRQAYVEAVPMKLAMLAAGEGARSILRFALATCLRHEKQHPRVTLKIVIWVGRSQGPT